MASRAVSLDVGQVRKLALSEIRDSTASEAVAIALDAWEASHPRRPLTLTRLDRFRNELAARQHEVDVSIERYEAKHHQPNPKLLARQGQLIEAWLGAVRLRDLLGVYAGLNRLDELTAPRSPK